MSSYNLIPVTDLLIHGYTTGIATTTFVSDIPVIVDNTVSANSFQSLTTGSAATPAYGFADQSAGLYYNIVGTTSTTFVFNGTTVGRLSFRGAPNVIFMPGTSATGLQDNGSAAGLVMLSGGGFGSFILGNAYCRIGFHGEAGLVAPTGGANLPSPGGFNFINAAFDTGIKVATLVASVPGAVAGLWPQSEGLYYARPGLLHQTTTTITPSVTRSGAHITNLIAGITTVFVTLPTATAGVEHIVSNARAVANTVVISPRAAGDQLNVFGLTKVAGASVSGSAPFASITFHCVTTSRWVATKQLGTWV